MDSFWSKLLILGIVAAIGMFFIFNVYTPQKAAQQAMADSTQQSVNAVKAGVEGTVPVEVGGTDVLATITSTCITGNAKVINVVKSGTTYTFTTEAKALTGETAASVVVTTKQYLKQSSPTAITFTEQP